MKLREELEPKESSKEYKELIKQKIIQIEYIINTNGNADEEINNFNTFTGCDYDFYYFASYNSHEDLDEFVHKASLSQPIKDPKITREELIEIVRRIQDIDNYVKYHEYYMELFDLNVKMPGASNLVFYPDDDDARRVEISEYNPTPEEIVEKALNYKPIAL